jgi:hypothetical protein
MDHRTARFKQLGPGVWFDPHAICGAILGQGENMEPYVQFAVEAPIALPPIQVNQLSPHSVELLRKLSGFPQTLLPPETAPAQPTSGYNPGRDDDDAG